MWMMCCLPVRRLLLRCMMQELYDTSVIQWKSLWLVGLFIICCFACSGLFAQDPDPNDLKPPLEMADYNWEKDAKNDKLTDSQIAVLKKQGFLITDTHYKQIFEPYLWGSQVFITSDTVINAYSILLEDSVLQMELANAPRLQAFLDGTWKQLADAEKKCPSDKPLERAAVERAQMMIGVALELSTGKKVKANTKLIGKIDEEAQRVIAATGQSKPAWLGPPDPGFLAIDYTRFKPRGFYAGKPSLERYFRVTSWLQAIPFRFDNDQEFMAFMLIYGIVHDYNHKDLWEKSEEMKNIGRTYSMLLGASDNADLFGIKYTVTIQCPFGAPGYLTEARSDRKYLTEDETKGLSQINDQIADLPKDGKMELNFRLLSAHRVPDALLFAKTDGIRKSNLSGGLEVASALGSPVARDIYKSQNAELLKKIDEEKKLFQKGSLYNDFLDAVAVLFHPVDKAAPDLFRSPAWKEKSLQTFLGGWAQARHIWVLQTKENVSYMGECIAVPSGFVEPVPDFFSKMEHLSERTLQCFQSAHFQATSNEDAADQIRSLVSSLKGYEKLLLQQDTQQITKQDKKALAAARLMARTDERYMISDPGWFWIDYVSEGMPEPTTPEQIDWYIPKLEALALRLEKDGTASDIKLQRLLEQQNLNPEALWIHLDLLCAKLEALSQKQLRGVPFSKDDNEFVYYYGQELAGIMFYGGNSYENPRDDAPRICDIYSNPQDGQFLEVGIGRPNQIYLLYPYGGKTILTHGAVFPYYEFSNDKRLTDQEWKDLLATPNAPHQPAWLGELSPRN